jgi:hypothetical protein
VAVLSAAGRPKCGQCDRLASPLDASFKRQHALDSIDSRKNLHMKPKRPWWQATTSLRPTLIICGCYLISGLGGFVGWLGGGKIWLAVLWGFYFLSGTPWYITAVVMLKQRRQRRTELLRAVATVVSALRRRRREESSPDQG